MIGWCHQLNEPEFEQTLGDSEEQGSLACCSPWSRKKLDMTWQLNKNNIIVKCDHLYLHFTVICITSFEFYHNALFSVSWCIPLLCTFLYEFEVQDC